MFRRNKPEKDKKISGSNPATGGLQRFSREELSNPENAEAPLRRAYNLWLQSAYKQIWAEKMNIFRLLGRDYMAGNYEKQSEVSDPKDQTALSLAVDFTYLGLFCAKKGKYEKSLSLYNPAIQMLVDYTPAYNNRGKIYFLQENYGLALEDFNRAVELNSDMAISFNNRAMAYLAIRQLDNALADAQKAIALDGDNANYYNNLALIYQQKKQHREAIDNFSQAIKLDTQLDIAYLSRAVSFYLMENKNDAGKDLKKFQQLHGSWATYNTGPDLLKALLKEQSGDLLSDPEIKTLIIKLDDMLPTGDNYQHQKHISLEDKKASFVDETLDNPGILKPQNPANKAILDHLSSKQGQLYRSLSHLSKSPDDAKPAGIHPDLQTIFWHDFTRQLPVDCKWVVYGNAILINPANGVIFGYASGTNLVLLRLPEEEHQFTPSRELSNMTLYAKDYGDDWSFVPLTGEGIEERCLIAYKYAGSL